MSDTSDELLAGLPSLTIIGMVSKLIGHISSDNRLQAASQNAFHTIEHLIAAAHRETVRRPNSVLKWDELRKQLLAGTVPGHSASAVLLREAIRLACVFNLTGSIEDA